MEEVPLRKSKMNGVVRFAGLADQIAADIRTRGLQPGDPYLNTAEIARHFRVSGTTANRALQLLVQRRMLDRRQRTGTSIAQPSDGPTSGILRRVHVVIHQNYLRTDQPLADALVLGLQRELPGTQIQFDFPPPADEADYVHGLITKSVRSHQPDGFVLVRSSVVTQRLFESSGLTTVVMGYLHPSVEGLYQIEKDQHQVGALLAGYLVDRGCKRVAVLLRDRVLPGEHQMLDGVVETLGRAGVGLGDFILRCLPLDPPAIQAEVRAILAESDRSTGILCRAEPLATAAAAAVATFNLKGKRQPVICADGVYLQDSSSLPYAHVRSCSGPDAIGRDIGRLLLRQVRTPKGPPTHQAIPVELVIPRTRQVTSKNG